MRIRDWAVIHGLDPDKAEDWLRSVESDTFHVFCRPSLAEQQPWLAWFALHGINPKGVAHQGWVERRIPERQIAYLGYELDASGDYVLPPDGVDVEKWWKGREMVLQLESPPLPFPV